MRPSHLADLEGVAEFESVEAKTVKEACSLLPQPSDKPNNLKSQSNSVQETETSQQKTLSHDRRERKMSPACLLSLMCA